MISFFELIILLTQRMNMNKDMQVHKRPDYHYCRHMGHYKLYRDNHDGTAEKIDQDLNEEVIRKKCYELNGWNYKPKSAKQ